jgi:hypothetical protein
MKNPMQSQDPIPMTWVREDDPLWEELWSRWVEERGKYKGERPPAIFSKHKQGEGLGWFFRTSWIVDIRSRQDEIWRQPGKLLTASKLRDSTAVQAKSGPEPWLPLKPGKRSETISAMERRWDAGKVNRHEYDTYAGTLRATAAILGGDDPDKLRCLTLAMMVEDQARLSDDAFVRTAIGWF